MTSKHLGFRDDATLLDASETPETPRRPRERTRIASTTLRRRIRDDVDRRDADARAERRVAGGLHRASIVVDRGRRDDDDDTNDGASMSRGGALGFRMRDADGADDYARWWTRDGWM